MLKVEKLEDAKEKVLLVMVGKRQVLESANVRNKAIPLESSFLTSRE
jgi:hypothetical protein